MSAAAGGLADVGGGWPCRCRRQVALQMSVAGGLADVDGVAWQMSTGWPGRCRECACRFRRRVLAGFVRHVLAGVIGCACRCRWVCLQVSLSVLAGVSIITLSTYNT